MESVARHATTARRRQATTGRTRRRACDHGADKEEGMR